MSEKEPTPGLLSKVAKFVRSPTTNWADLDRQEPEQDQGYSKQALKEMIERKRQNDFVRKREFDQLRKLRSRGPGAVNPDLARPSFFQTSMPANSDERAMTIKKIEQSIARIDSGDYGYCDETGEPIGVGRLLARPTATLSLEAQQRRELKQKMFGD